MYGATWKPLAETSARTSSGGAKNALGISPQKTKRRISTRGDACSFRNLNAYNVTRIYERITGNPEVMPCPS